MLNNTHHLHTGQPKTVFIIVIDVASGNTQYSRLRALNPGRYQLLHQIVCSILVLVIRASTFFLLQVWLFWELPEDFTMSRTVGIELVMVCLAK